MSVRFAGYAAVFDRPDRGGDVVRSGAFGTPRPVPLLWQHRGRPVGVIEALSEDTKGLRVIGRIDDPALAAQVRGGAVTGLSFGYRATGVKHRHYRELTHVALIEVRLVEQPMQPLARVHAVVSDAKQGG